VWVVSLPPAFSLLTRDLIQNRPCQTSKPSLRAMDLHSWQGSLLNLSISLMRFCSAATYLNLESVVMPSANRCFFSLALRFMKGIAFSFAGYEATGGAVELVIF
jgi:hypothetical protein